MECYEFEIRGGVTALLKPRCKSTRLAGFAEQFPGAIEAVNQLVSTTTGPLKVDERLAGLFIKGLSTIDTEGVIDFLAEQIDGFSLPDDADTDWQAVDWKALAPKEREETIDFLLSTLDLVSLFIAAWSHYQGMGVRTRRA